MAPQETHSARGRLHEQSFNLGLGAALAETDARWRANNWILAEREHVLERGRADVVITDPAMPVVAIEASFQAADANRDARKRLGQTTRYDGRRILSVLAVHIPPECRSLDEGEIATKLRDQSLLIGYVLHQKASEQVAPRRWPTAGFIRGTVYSAARLISAASMPREAVESHAEMVAMLVKQAAATLQSNLSPRAQQEVARVVGQNSPLEGLRTTMVLWLNALLTQQRLYTQGVAGIPHLQGSSGVRPHPAEQLQVWQQIIAMNWRSIFGPAVKTLGACGDRHIQATSDALVLLIKAVILIENSRLGRHINVGAELFPKLASDRKESAAFYTQPATAELLAYLTIRGSDKPDSFWSRPDLLRRSIIADLACGTGTLLRAGYLRVQTLHERAGGTQASLTQLHQGAMESGLRGTDVSPIAAHLTCSSLASIGQGESYGNTQVGWVRVGGPLAQTGALEYLVSEVAQDLFGQSHSVMSGVIDEKSAVLDKAIVKIGHDSVDWVLMNPPYSRTRRGQSAFDLTGVTKADRKRCQKRWKQLVKNKPAQLLAGMAASFLVIAKHKVKPGSGRIGFVLPLTCAFADTWMPTRAMIESEFSDVIVIATAGGASLSHASFSADTGMEEMLLVATRRKQVHRKASTMLHCVTLYEPCVRNGEASETGRAIKKSVAYCTAPGMTYPITVGDGEIGCVTAMSTSGTGSPWSVVGVTHGGLALAADALTQGTLDHVVAKPISLGLEMETIGDIFDVGPTHHLLGHMKDHAPIGAFEFHPVRNEADAFGSDRALWRAVNEQQRSLRVLPTHKGLCPPGVGSDEQREAMRATASTLFYARNLRWTSQALLAATTAQPALGGSTWTAVAHADERVLKAAALWWNSTLGLIVHWTQGQRTQIGRSRTQINALKKIPCPRLDKLSDAALAAAVERFDQLQNAQLLPAREAAKDPVRRRIDASVSEILAINRRIDQAVTDQESTQVEQVNNAVGIIGKLWCLEPSVHGKKKAIENIDA